MRQRRRNSIKSSLHPSVNAQRPIDCLRRKRVSTISVHQYPARLEIRDRIRDYNQNQIPIKKKLFKIQLKFFKHYLLKKKSAGAVTEMYRTLKVKK